MTSKRRSLPNISCFFSLNLLYLRIKHVNSFTLRDSFGFYFFLAYRGQIKVVGSRGKEEGGIYAKYGQMLFNLTEFPFSNTFECEANK